MEAEPTCIGVPWFTRDDYKKLRRMFTDTEVLPACYKVWRENAEIGFRDLVRQGFVVVKVPIDAEVFPDWCRENGLRRDAFARAKFSSVVAAEDCRGRDIM